MPESQLLSLDLSFPICKMEAGVKGVLQLLTITAIEVTSTKPVCPASPVLSVFSARGLVLSPGGPPRPQNLLRSFRKHEYQAALRPDSVGRAWAWALRFLKLPGRVLMRSQG